MEAFWSELLAGEEDMSFLLLAVVAGADLLLLNGRVHAMDAARPEASALLLRGERIVAVGSEAEVRSQAAAGARVLDLGGGPSSRGSSTPTPTSSRPW